MQSNDGAKPLSYATIILVAANVIYFLVMYLNGSVNTTAGLVASGAIYIQMGQYMGGISELFKAMFIHFDIYHLGSNMLMLAIVGDMLEKRLGMLRVTAAYIITGLAGNIAAVAVYSAMGRTVVTAGASGAVYGLLGVLVFLALRNRGSVPGFGKRRVIIMIILMLYSGVSSSGINLTAHVAGLIAGVILGLFYNGAWNRGRSPDNIYI